MFCTAAMSVSADFTRATAAISAAFCLSRSPFMASISALSLSDLSLLSDSDAASSLSCAAVSSDFCSIQVGTPVPSGASGGADAAAALAVDDEGAEADEEEEDGSDWPRAGRALRPKAS